MLNINSLIYYTSVILLVLLQISDVVVTYYGIDHNYAEECNQLVIILINIFGLLPTLILTKIFAFGIIYFIFLNKPKYTLDRLIPMVLLVLIYVYVVINNLQICHLI